MPPFPPPSPRRHHADGPLGRARFQALGDGMPLVLPHQAPMTSGQFGAGYAALAARGLMAIGIHMPGFGMSDPAPGAPTVADFARVVPAAVDALGIECALLPGHHTGDEIHPHADARAIAGFRQIGLPPTPLDARR